MAMQSTSLILSCIKYQKFERDPPRQTILLRVGNTTLDLNWTYLHFKGQAFESWKSQFQGFFMKLLDS
jgi:hypothetical protein